MGVDPLTIGLAAGGLGLGLFSSMEQAQKQNKAVKKSVAAAHVAADTEKRQLTAQEQQAKERRIQDSRRLRASILAAGGVSGFDLSSGDFNDAVASSDAFASQDIGNLATNLTNMFARVDSGLGSQLVSIDATKRNVFGDSLTGGLSGLGAGLSLGSNIDTISNAADRQQQILDARNGSKLSDHFIGPRP